MNNLADFARAACRRAILLTLVALTGCGTTRSQQATEQLLVSDAVDRAVCKIDFSVLSGQKVYLDTKYIKLVKGTGFVNADYIVSSLRQQMAAANCMLEEKPEEADIIVEARVGGLGTDSHDVTFGIPESKSLNTAASLLAHTPSIPIIPEIALAKKTDQRGAAKIGLFAYERETREPIWQSGLSLARSTATDTWFLGAGPFQRGSVYDGTSFAGSKLDIPFFRRRDRDRGEQEDLLAFRQARYYRQPARPAAGAELAEIGPNTVPPRPGPARGPTAGVRSARQPFDFLGRSRQTAR